MIFEYITIMNKLENDSINTVKKQNLIFIELFTDSLVASYVTHLFTLVCDSLDVTFGIKAT